MKALYALIFALIFSICGLCQPPSGLIQTVAGDGTKGDTGDGGPPLSAALRVSSIAIDSNANLYILDPGDYVVRKVSNGVITTVAGNGTAGYGGDGGSATSAQINYALSIAVDAADNLFIADALNNRIRKVSKGIITTVAGNGTAGYAGDGGSATSAKLNGPVSVAVDTAGNLYIADALNFRVRKVTNGNITTIAGTGTSGYSGDGGPAMSAAMKPGLLALDNAGNLYVSAVTELTILGTAEPAVVRKISNGTITTVPGISGVLQTAVGVAVDASNNLFVADSFGNRVYRVSKGVATVVAGTGAKGSSGDGGPATAAQFNFPLGLAFGPGGNLYIGDAYNYRIRAVRFPGSMPQIASAGTWDTQLTLLNLSGAASPATLTFSGDAGSTLSLPFTFPQGSGSPVTTASLTETVNGHSLLQLDTTGPGAQAQIGWAQLQNIGGVTGFAIFSDPVFKWNAVVPLENLNASSYLLAFDNTSPLTTGVALANMAGQAANVNVTIRDDTGAQLHTDTISLPAEGHTSFMLPTKYTSAGGKRGTVEFDTPAGGQISVLGLRANQISATASALTTLPVLASVGSGGGSITHATWNQGFNTIFTLVNTGSTPASATLSFFGDDGSPLLAPLSFPQTGAVMKVSQVTQTIQPNATLVMETMAQGPSAVTGSAQLTTTGDVGGFGIFHSTTFGQEASVPLETRNLSSYFLAFDNTGGLTTGLALANVSGKAASVPVVIRDDTGTILLNTTINLPAKGHTSFLLPANYPAANGKRGTLEFDTPSGGQISVIGLRAKNDGTLTTIPVLGQVN